MRVPAIIQSGWWVAAAAVVFSLATAWIIIDPVSSRSSADAPQSEFVLHQATVPHDLVVRAMAKDGVRVLLDPATMSPTEVDRWNEEQRGKLLVPDDRVIGVAFGGEARAYPLRLMRWLGLGRRLHALPGPDLGQHQPRRGLEGHQRRLGPDAGSPTPRASCTMTPCPESVRESA